jgi:hypothetical protein
MHTTQVKSTTFLHNGDLSGKVIIKEVQGDSSIGHDIVNIPFEDLEAFVIQHSEKVKRWKADSERLSWQPLPELRGDM